VTLRARSSKLADVHDSLSGGGEGVRRQLVDEMKATDKQVRERILKEAGITPEITVGEGVAMKAELALPWRKLRHLRRYMYTVLVMTHTQGTLQDYSLPSTHLLRTHLGG